MTGQMSEECRPLWRQTTGILIKMQIRRIIVSPRKKSASWILWKNENKQNVPSERTSACHLRVRCLLGDAKRADTSVEF